MEELLQVSEISVSYKPHKGHKPVIRASEDAYKVAKHFFPDDTIGINEQVVVLYLNRANKVIAAYKLSSGGINGTVADLRLLFSVGLKSLATSFIIAHNHPSGSLEPSQHDNALTLRLKEAGRLIDIKMTDHIILVPQSETYYSYAEHEMV